MTATPAKLMYLKSSVRQVYDDVLLLPHEPFPNPVPAHVADGLIKNNIAYEDRERGTIRNRAMRPSVINTRAMTADDDRVPATAPPPPPITPPQPQRPPQQPEAPEEAAASAAESTDTDESETPTPSRRKGRYNRRDLRVDEDVDGA